MSDIEALMALVDKYGEACDNYTLGAQSAQAINARAAIEAAILADREKSFQNENQAQESNKLTAARGVEYQVLGYVSRYGKEIHDTLDAVGPGQPVYIRVATEASKPVQECCSQHTEAPTASNAGEREASDAYFKARAWMLDTADRRNVFSAGYRAALTQVPEQVAQDKIDAARYRALRFHSYTTTEADFDAAIDKTMKDAARTSGEANHG